MWVLQINARRVQNSRRNKLHTIVERVLGNFLQERKGSASGDNMPKSVSSTSQNLK
jgi:hypothetical protein